MKFPSLLLTLTLGVSLAHADEALFIGNSYTYGTAPVQGYGGVPKLVQEIAKAKGKDLTTDKVVAGGKDLGYHLQQPATYDALAAKPWKWIVVQDHSLQATKMGKTDEFFQNGETLYRKAREAEPSAKIVLYETWASDKAHSIYTGPKGYASPAEMIAEISKNYHELSQKLEAIDPGEQVAFAPVGEAFAACVEKHPEIDLYAKDRRHPSAAGSYLAALVIYGTLYGDDPVGAKSDFGDGVAIEESEAKALQEIARGVLKAGR